MKISICILIVVSQCCSLAVAEPKSKRKHSHSSKRITNAQDAKRNQFPYQISLQTGEGTNWTHICGGSIITNNVIVTAGHCVINPPQKGTFRVVAGILKLDEDVDTKQVFAVSNVIIHPMYEGWTSPNDIALLVLDKKIQWNAAVGRINLPQPNATFTGSKAVASGWGSISTTEKNVMPNTMQMAEFTVLSQADCSNALIRLQGSTEPYNNASHICTGPLNNRVSVCQYDSGGPLAKDGQLIGIIDLFVTPCGTKGAPSMYTQVSRFIDFIEEHIYC